jgi:hypothetical protein
VVSKGLTDPRLRCVVMLFRDVVYFGAKRAQHHLFFCRPGRGLHEFGSWPVLSGVCGRGRGLFGICFCLPNRGAVRSVSPTPTDRAARSYGMCMHFVCWWCRGNEGLPPVSWPLCAREKATAGRESWSSMGTTGWGVNALWGRMGVWVCGRWNGGV